MQRISNSKFNRTSICILYSLCCLAKAKDCALKNHDSDKTSMLLHERLDNLSN